MAFIDECDKARRLLDDLFGGPGSVHVDEFRTTVPLGQTDSTTEPVYDYGWTWKAVVQLPYGHPANIFSGTENDLFYFSGTGRFAADTLLEQVKLRLGLE